MTEMKTNINKKLQRLEIPLIACGNVKWQITLKKIFSGSSKVKHIIIIWPKNVTSTSITKELKILFLLSFEMWTEWTHQSKDKNCQKRWKNQEPTIGVHKKLSLKIQHKLKAKDEERKCVLILIKISLECLCWFQTKQKRTVMGERRPWSKHKGASSPTRHNGSNCVCI